MRSYTTRQQVEDYLAISIPDSIATAAEGVKSTLDGWIEAVSNFIFQRTGREFTPPAENAAETRVYDGSGNEKLDIDDCLSVCKLVIDGAEISAGDYFLYPANKTPKTQIQLKTGTARNSRLVFASTANIFTDLQQNVAVTGRFGYGEEVPADIQLAATKLVGGIIKESVGDKDVREITSETLGDYSADYAKISEIAHALNVDQLLAPYSKNTGRAKTAIVGL